MPSCRSLLLALLCCLPFPLLAADEYPLSLSLQTLERDLASRDYHEVLATMIPTDLAAEWQRVATSDNYHLFAQRHGGMEKIESSPALKAAYEKRKEIATRYLQLMRDAYAQKQRPAPFEDEAVLLATLASVDRKGLPEQTSQLSITPILPVPGAENQWTGLRGPGGQGVVFDTRIPSRWSSTENIAWKTKLPGRGNSSPIIWGERLFVTAQGPEEGSDVKAGPERLLLCYDRRDGKLRWRHAAPKPAEAEKLYWKNTYASSTPVTDGERVIAFFGNGGLVCCDYQGKQLWHVDLGAFPTTHGPGATPVLYHDLVIVIQDQNRGVSLCAAFDKRTGEERWRRERKNNMGWATPVLLNVGERDELIYNGSHEISSYDPATGKDLWRLSGTSQEAIPMIVAGGGLLYSASGRNGPIMAIRPGGSGDITDTHIVWRNERGGPHVPSPAFHDGRLYIVNDTGIFACLDASTGETLWQQRLRGRFSTSPLLFDDKLLLLNEEGVTWLIKSSPRYEPLGMHDLGETTLATPAILDGRIFFRTEEHLICVSDAEAK